MGLYPSSEAHLSQWIDFWRSNPSLANRVCRADSVDRQPHCLVDQDPMTCGRDTVPLVSAMRVGWIDDAAELLSLVPDVDLHVPLNGYGPDPVTVVELAERGYFERMTHHPEFIAALLVKARQFPVDYKWKATAIMRATCRLPDDVARLAAEYAGLSFPEAANPFAIAATRARKRQRIG